MKPEFPRRLSLPRLHHYADSFPISRVTSLFENLACPQGKFRLLRVASEAFHLCVLPYSPALSLTLAQMHSGQHINGPQSWQHFTITWGDFLKNTVIQTVCTSRDLGSGPQGICMISINPWAARVENHCSPKLVTFCCPNLPCHLWGFRQGFLTLPCPHFFT